MNIIVISLFSCLHQEADSIVVLPLLCTNAPHLGFDTRSRRRMCYWFPVQTCFCRFFQEFWVSSCIKTGMKDLRTPMEIIFFREAFFNYPWLPCLNKHFFLCPRRAFFFLMQTST